MKPIDLDALTPWEKERAALRAQVKSLQERGNTLIEEARAARHERDVARVTIAALSEVLFEKAEDERKLTALMRKAELYVRCVSLRSESPPKWNEEARALADEMHEVVKDA